MTMEWIQTPHSIPTFMETYIHPVSIKNLNDLILANSNILLFNFFVFQF